MGAGLLPTAIHNNKLYFYLERKTNMKIRVLDGQILEVERIITKRCWKHQSVKEPRN